MVRLTITFRILSMRATQEDGHLVDALFLFCDSFNCRYA